jgi:putative transposase
MVADPHDYGWSSHACNAYGKPDPLVLPHPAYLALSADPAKRQLIYRSLVMEAVDPAEIEAIRQHVQRQHAYGSGRFRRAIEAQLGRSAGPQKIGRPRKSKAID